MPAEYFFRLYTEYHTNACLALNIKADGLQDVMKHLLDAYDITNYFVFDMSVCDTMGYIEHKFKLISRVSEYEHELPFLSKSSGIWYDMFHTNTFNEQEIISYLSQKKELCIVSPELHNRKHLTSWEQYEKIKGYSLMLCTDRPMEANSYFNGVIK
jgi:hypothetical protein